MPAAPQVLAFLYLGLGSMFLGFFAWNVGLAMGGIARVSQVQLLQTFVTLAISAVLLGERITGETMAFDLAVMVVVMLGRKARIARPLTVRRRPARPYVAPANSTAASASTCPSGSAAETLFPFGRSASVGGHTSN